MVAAECGLFDTSVFIAQGAARPLDESSFPTEVAISVITLAELNAGVLAAADTEVRAIRMKTLDAVADIEVLPITEQIAVEWARLRVHLAEQQRRIPVNDLWIAATAVAHGLPVVSQDADFEPLDGVDGLTIIRV